MEYRSLMVVAVAMSAAALVFAGASACSSSTTTAAASNDATVQTTDVCKQSTNYNDCFTCCGPSVGYTTASEQYQQCMCPACSDPCASSVCGDFDASTNPDAGPPGLETADCKSCLDNGTGSANCAAQASNTCNADSDCARFSACLQAACLGLPETDAGH